jgi:hypothetical protein
VKLSSRYDANRRHSRKIKHTSDEERQAETCRKLKEFLTYDGRLHNMGHTKGQDNKRYSPLSPRTTIDEAIVKEGAVGVLVDHGQGE